MSRLLAGRAAESVDILQRALSISPLDERAQAAYHAALEQRGAFSQLALETEELALRAQLREERTVALLYRHAQTLDERAQAAYHAALEQRGAFSQLALETEELALRAQLREERTVALLYRHAQTVARLGRPGEAFVIFQEGIRQARITGESGDLLSDAELQVQLFSQENIASAESTWRHVLALKTRPLDLATPFSRAAELMLYYQAGNTSARKDARVLLEGVASSLQQHFGLDFQLRLDWDQADSFPFTRGAIYGPGLSQQYGPVSESKDTPTACTQVVVVETWRFQHHSYALVGQQMLLGLWNDPAVCVFVMNPPYSNRDWVPGELGETQTAEKDAELMAIPVWNASSGYCPDVVIRAYFPFDVMPFPCRRTHTYVFGATEFKRASYLGLKTLGFWNETAVSILTPSQVFNARPKSEWGTPPPPHTHTHAHAHEIPFRLLD